MTADSQPMDGDCDVAAQIPVIETERLIMRGYRLGDFPSCVAMWGDPLVTRYIGGKPASEADAWRKLVFYTGHWALLGFGFWALEEKATGSFVGEAGFGDFKRDIQPSLQGIPEIGWVLTPSAHGRGLATEAVRAAVDWGARHFGPVRTACLIAPGNTASIRVAEKCGYRAAERTTYTGEPVTIFRRSLAVGRGEESG